MRLYPVWQFAHEGPYQSVYDALLAVRHLTPQQLAAGPEALEVGFFNVSDLPELAFPRDREVLAKWHGSLDHTV